MKWALFKHLIVAILGFPSSNANSPKEPPASSLAISTNPGSISSKGCTSLPSDKRQYSSSSVFFLLSFLLAFIC
jgi:hypothetical protein